MPNDEDRPRALITGASAGIGQGFAKHLAKRGYDVVLVARRKDRLDQLAADITADGDTTADVLAADLAAEDGVALVEQRLRSGDIDVLVNNAGFGTVGDFGKLPLEKELEELDVNVRALMRLTHAALSSMLPRKRGSIINVASTAAFQAIPHNATYAATKAFVLHFSEAIHEEAKPHGVTVTCVCPGPVKTEFQEVAGMDDVRIPSIAWESVDTVVKTALSAMRGGRAIAVPGTLNMLSAVSTRVVPRFLTRRIAGSIFRDQGP